MHRGIADDKLIPVFAGERQEIITAFTLTVYERTMQLLPLKFVVYNLPSHPTPSGRLWKKERKASVYGPASKPIFFTQMENRNKMLKEVFLLLPVTETQIYNRVVSNSVKWAMVTLHLISVQCIFQMPIWAATTTQEKANFHAGKVHTKCVLYWRQLERGMEKYEIHTYWINQPWSWCHLTVLGQWLQSTYNLYTTFDQTSWYGKGHCWELLHHGVFVKPLSSDNWWLTKHKSLKAVTPPPSSARK